jgi:ATP-grasp domain
MNNIIYNTEDLPVIWGLGSFPMDRLAAPRMNMKYSIVSSPSASERDYIESYNINIIEYDDVGEEDGLAETKDNESDNKFLDFCTANGSPTLLVYKPKKKYQEWRDNYGVNILMNEYYISRQIWENKRRMRAKLDPKYFAPFRLLEPEEKIEMEYDEIVSNYGLPFVLQDAILGGGRGTFIIKDQEYFQLAKSHLMTKKNGAVISSFVTGISASIQVCITKFGIFHGPLQKNLSEIKELCYTDGIDAEGFCGGEWGSPELDKYKDEVYCIALEIGAEVAKDSIYGIFGIDFILGERAFVIETNMRLTGLTSPLTHQWLAASVEPLISLHILELSKTDYKIDNVIEYQNNLLNTKPFTFLLLHNTSKDAITRMTKLSEEYKSITPQISLIGEPVLPGKRLARVYYNALLTEGNNLNSKGKQLVQDLLGNYSNNQLI